MITSNAIAGLLNCNVQIMNSKIKLYYEISSKQPLNLAFAKKSIGIQELSGLIFGILRMSEELKRYLLDGAHIILEPEYIYVDAEQNQFYFCYFPCYEKEITDSFRSLSEFLLNHLNYKENNCVTLGYELCQYTAQENYSLRNVLEKIWSKASEAQLKGKQEETEDSVLTAMQEDRMFEYEEESLPAPNAKSLDENRNPKKIWNRILGNKAEGENKRGKTIHKKLDIQNKIDRSEAFQYSEPHGNTKLLHTSNKELFDLEDDYKKLLCLQHGEYPDFTIEEYPFIIGKLGEWVDGVIEYELVSRMHAQIVREKGVYFVKDLNSTNGTYLNEKRLSTNELAELKEGDIVEFGGIRYQFE